ncbi:MAG: co-chaperone GroES family protein [Nitrospiraceae bacterium]|nr:co-chaperone GroES family protein [Nitrospiraceae bacterium]MDA8326678.1 co-chaperone GroES family protein [Nitrospiraceae bacterium]
METKKNLIIVGDRVLIEPDSSAGKSAAGLYLPPNIKEREKVQAGKVVKTGPGYPIPDTSIGDDPPWAEKKRSTRYFPLEALEGDYAIFLKNDAVEIEFEGKKYVIVPHSSILALVRTEILERD